MDATPTPTQPTGRAAVRSVTLTNDMRRVVSEQRLGFVATVCPDGTPNVSPKGTVAVWDDQHLVFADLRSPRTVANLRWNPVVEINVVDPLVRKGYRFKGHATVLTDGPVFDAVVAFYGRGEAALRDAGRRIRSVVLVQVERAVALVSPAYDLGLNEQEVSGAWLQHYGLLKHNSSTPAPASPHRTPEDT